MSHPTASSMDERECPCCGWTGKEFSPCPYGPIPRRKNAECPRCQSLERHRLYYLFLKDVIPESRSIRVLHFAPEKALAELFATYKNIEYIGADLNPDSSMPESTVKQDITKLTFPDNYFDIIFCSHVLEHVENDHAAMSELRRVLRPGGFAILQAPIHDVYQGKQLQQTFEDPSAKTPELREKLFGQKDHVRVYARDYKDRLEKAGFKVKIEKHINSFSKAEIKRYALLPEGDLSETNGWIYFCKKR